MQKNHGGNMVKKILLLLAVATIHAVSFCSVDPFISRRTINNTYSQPAPRYSPPVYTQPSIAKPTVVHHHTVHTVHHVQPTPPDRVVVVHTPPRTTYIPTPVIASSAAIVASSWCYDLKLYAFAAGAGLVIAGVLIYLATRSQEYNTVTVVSTPTPAPIPVPVPVVYTLEDLFYACKKNDTQTVRIILNAQPSLLNAQSNSGETALITASSAGSYNVVAELLNHGAYVETMASNGNTALKVACAYGHSAIAQALINAGATMEPSVQNPFSPLMVAVWHGQLEMVKLLLHNGAQRDACITFSALDIIQQLLRSEITQREREIYNAIAYELSR